jgi:hypothetical protein
VGLSARDSRILALAARRATNPKDFEAALRALRDAVEELIPAGRIFFLGAGTDGPIVGSLVSGVGITVEREEIIIVRRHPANGVKRLGRFSP